MNTIIRPIRDHEIPLLGEFLYEAIFIPEGTEPPSRDIVKLPELQVYVDGFGTGSADHCLAAEADGQIIGAVWVRIMNDYGHVDDRTPSLAISLLKEYRNQGIGTALLQQMLDLLRREGYAQVSLSVQKANYAVKMYTKAGFKPAAEHDEELIMVCDLI